jgi:hypothetical protein
LTKDPQRDQKRQSKQLEPKTESAELIRNGNFSPPSDDQRLTSTKKRIKFHGKFFQAMLKSRQGA